MPIFDLFAGLLRLFFWCVLFAVGHWKAVVAGYGVLTLFGWGQRARWATLRNVAVPVIGFVALHVLWRRSPVFRFVLKVAAVAAWLWVARVTDWPGRMLWLAVSALLVFGHLVATYGWRSIWAGVPLGVDPYLKARKERQYRRAARRGLASVQDERALLRGLSFITDGILHGFGRPAPGKSPGALVADGADETIGNAINAEAELFGLKGVNVSVQRARGADGRVEFLMWEPGSHPLDRDLPWPGPHTAKTRDPVPLGVTLRGDVYSVPCPGDRGRYMIIGGTTGTGKSTTINVMLGELAPRPHTDLVIADPKCMDYSWTWSPRALHIADGIEQSVEACRLVQKEMHFRRRWAQAHRLREIIPGTPHDPTACEACSRHGWDRRSFSHLHLFIDEMALIMLGPAKVADQVTAICVDITSAGRATAIGWMGATQSPKATVIRQIIKENCSVRIAFATEEPEQTEAILSTQRVPAHTALTLAGESFGKQDRDVTRWRGWYATDEQLEAVASATAHLRGTLPSIGTEVSA